MSDKAKKRDDALEDLQQQLGEMTEALQRGISKDCDTYRGETEEITWRREVTTDKDGRYSFTVFGLVWNWHNYVSDAECTSHVQRFSCRPYCKKADDVDIDVLGK